MLVDTESYQILTEEGCSVNLNDAKHLAMLEEWRARVYECRNSGIPVKRWCIEQGISISTYFRWQRAVWKSKEIQTAFQAVSTQQNNGLQIAEITLPAEVEQDQQDQQDMVNLLHQVPENRPRVKQSREQPVAVIRNGKLSCEIRNGIDPEILRQIMRLVNSYD